MRQESAILYSNAVSVGEVRGISGGADWEGEVFRHELQPTWKRPSQDWMMQIVKETRRPRIG